MLLRPYFLLGSAFGLVIVEAEVVSWLGVRGADGRPLGPAPKALGSGIRYVAGGTVFGFGWALTE